MDRVLVWKNLETGGMEWLRLEQDERGIHAKGVVDTGLQDEMAEIQYSLKCNQQWQFTSIALINTTNDSQFLLERTSNGIWIKDGQVRTDLEGCFDIDLSISPLTNTLPIRRLELSIGATADIDVAYLNIIEGAISKEKQRYSRISERVYTFESISRDNTVTYFNTLEVDEEGLVIRYPELFMRQEEGV